MRLRDLINDQRIPRVVRDEAIVLYEMGFEKKDIKKFAQESNKKLISSV